MNLKEMVSKIFSTYFILVTCILVAIMTMGLIFDPNAQLEYRSLAAPLVYALLGTVPIVVMYSEKELTTKQLVIRKIIQITVTEIELMLYFIFNPTIDTSEPKKIIGIAVSIFLVYVFANIINYVNNYFTAQRMTKDLINFQKNAK